MEHAGREFHFFEQILRGLESQLNEFLPEGPAPRMGKFRIHIAQLVLSSKVTGLAPCELEAEGAKACFRLA